VFEAFQVFSYEAGNTLLIPSPSVFVHQQGWSTLGSENKIRIKIIVGIFSYKKSH
jgi:hypothetical protein